MRADPEAVLQQMALRFVHDVTARGVDGVPREVFACGFLCGAMAGLVASAGTGTERYLGTFIIAQEKRSSWERVLTLALGPRAEVLQ